MSATCSRCALICGRSTDHLMDDGRWACDQPGWADGGPFRALRADDQDDDFRAQQCRFPDGPHTCVYVCERPGCGEAVREPVAEVDGQLLCARHVPS